MNDMNPNKNFVSKYIQNIFKTNSNKTVLNAIESCVCYGIGISDTSKEANSINSTRK